MLDPAAAVSLRELFTASASDYPRLLGEAEVIFQGKNETKCHFKTKTPAETAEILQHIINHEDGVFARPVAFDTPGPLYFRMYKRLRLRPDNKEAKMLAFNFTFHESDKRGALWLSDPKMNSYYWQGDERIENRPPFTCPSPPLKDVIAILRKAGDDWKNVNFMRPVDGPKLKLVSSQP